jgi:hypothetical protein
MKFKLKLHCDSISPQPKWLASRKQTTKNSDKDAEENEPLYTIGGRCKLVQPLWKSVLGFPKKLKMELPYDPAVSLLGIYPKECKSAFKRDR